MPNGDWMAEATHNDKDNKDSLRVLCGSVITGPQHSQVHIIPVTALSGTYTILILQLGKQSREVPSPEATGTAPPQKSFLYSTFCKPLVLRP